MVATGNTRSMSGTRPDAENTMMKATIWSSMTRSEPITPPSITVGCRSDPWSGSDLGATASEIPDMPISSTRAQGIDRLEGNERADRAVHILTVRKDSNNQEKIGCSKRRAGECL